MRAILHAEYGPPEVMRLEEVAQPVPGAGEVLVRVRAASLNPLDWHYLRGEPQLMRLSTGWSRPKQPRLGTDVAGVVEAVGPGVTQHKPGDEVFGVARGALADFVCTAAGSLVKKPAALSFVQAAALPVAGVSALQALRDRGGLRAGQSVLINGASGGVGTFAVQLARVLGAEVTGVCSKRNVDLVRSLGVTVVVDYTREDFTRSGQRYDLILDTVGNRPFSELKRVLVPSGTVVIVGGPPGGRWLGPFATMLRMKAASWFSTQRVRPMFASLSTADLQALGEFAEKGTVKPVIDRCYPLEQAAEAMRYLETGHVRGKVVVTTGPCNRSESDG